MVVWEQVKAEVTTPHISYAVVGFALVLFGTVSLFLKEKLYIGEATVATIYGLIVGPHCLNWFSPKEWGNTDYITLEISRIVLIVQIFAVAVELPKKYMLRHWWSVGMLLLPVMVFGWVVSAVFIWKLVPSLRWLDALCIAGCVTATDPVLASAVVGKGKFARRVPGHLRNLLSAESACNDGMAYPFVILAVYIEKYEHNAPEIAKEFICVGVLYSCCLGILIGAVIGYASRHLIKFAEQFNLIDRESFLVYYFCVAFFCAGVGTLCGVDDLLVAFSAGTAFSWDGWFSRQTEESHVSNVIDVLLNTAFFVYFGAIVPWPDFNNYELGIKAWKLVCVAIIILVVRRIPIMLAIKPITPDIHTWREALFCGHFGPIGVGAIFMCLLARAQIESSSETPLKELVPHDDPHYFLVATLWPITCFLVIASIVVHGSSVAVFTLGQRINDMAITLTYTTGGNEPSWMSRLPRRSTEGGNILQLQRMETEEPFAFKKKRRKRRSASFLHRKKENGDDSAAPQDLDRARRPGAMGSEQGGHDAMVPDEAGFSKETDPHANTAQDKEDKRASSVVDLKLTLDLSDAGKIERTEAVAASKLESKPLTDINAYREGKAIMVEDTDGNFIHKFDIGDSKGHIKGKPHLEIVMPESTEASKSDLTDQEVTDRSKCESSQGDYAYDSRSGTEDSYETEKDVAVPQDMRRSHNSLQRPRRRSIPRLNRSRSVLEMPQVGRKAHAYMIDNMVYVENEDGDILRRYKYVPRGSHPEEGKHGSGTGPFSKVRSFFTGWSKSKERPHDDEKFNDVEHAPEPLLIPEGGDLSESSTSNDISAEDEKAVRRRLSQLLRTGQIDHQPSQPNSNYGTALGSRVNSTIRSQAVTSEEDNETDTENEDDDAEPETAVERHRRLAALGIIPTEMSREDEEDDITNNAGGSQSAAGEEPKITFKLPERR